MFEKVNPCHPDKIADRIAGAIVDLAYNKVESGHPKVAVEVLIGHGICHIINETSEHFTISDIEPIVKRIAGDVKVDYKEYKQDVYLAKNQSKGVRCGDNGIFKGVPVTEEQKRLSQLVKSTYFFIKSDGKYIYDLRSKTLIACQSNAEKESLYRGLKSKWFNKIVINPLGDWTGGTDVDTGATNRKLGSDMGDSITGGGLHGKDLSKADVSVNIYAWLKAQQTGKPVKIYCAIGDEYIDGKPYSDIVKIAREYIDEIGGFEKFAEWGLI